MSLIVQIQRVYGIGQQLQRQDNHKLKMEKISRKYMLPIESIMKKDIKLMMKAGSSLDGVANMMNGNQLLVQLSKDIIHAVSTMKLPQRAQ